MPKDKKDKNVSVENVSDQESGNEMEMEFLNIGEQDDEDMEENEDDMEDEEDIEEESGEEETDEGKKSKKQKKKGKEEPMSGQSLVFEKSAYIMYHQLQTQSPCLSFDVIPDLLGEDRKFPHTCYLVAGTQAAANITNRVMAMKISGMEKMNQDESDSESETEEEEGGERRGNKEPELKIAMMMHKGCVNRIRVTKLHSVSMAASWSELGKVHIWDLTKPLHALDDPEYMKKYVQNKEAPNPTFTFSGHQGEGYALDWSPTVAGRLATGDCKGNIHVWSPENDGSWTVDRRAYSGHTESVEDIQWSPDEENVFSSCSVDKSLRVFDIRAPPLKANMLTVSDAHDSDINVISWNRHEPFIASGGDDGIIKVWDLRQFTNGQSVAVFQYHTSSITSVEWHPTDSTVFAASGADDKLTQWDIAAERDETSPEEQEDLPAQLLFVHQGQTDMKELHWHPQINGVVISTALSGFDAFRTISV